MTQYRFFQHNFDENWTIVFKTVDNLKNGLNFDQFGRQNSNKQKKYLGTTIDGKMLKKIDGEK